MPKNPLLSNTSLGEEKEEQFDNSLPHDGWELSIGRNHFVMELVPQLPRSGSIIEVPRSTAKNDKEWHGIVHKVSGNLDDHFQAWGLKPGERVVISGSPVSCFLNGREFIICPFNAIQGVLRRQDGSLFVGSKYGHKALECPPSQ